MQEIYRVFVRRKGPASYYEAELNSRVGVYLTERGNLSPAEIPVAILEMLAARGQRFIGSMPDFHSQYFGNNAFFVIAEPIAEAAKLQVVMADGPD